MKKQLSFALTSLFDRFSDAQLIAAVPKIKLRQVYWDDLHEGDSVTFEVTLSEKLGLWYLLLMGNGNPIHFQKVLKGKNIVPSDLLMAFISAVGGCYLGGENVFLVKKKEAFFYLPISFDANTLIITGEVMSKYTEEIKNKERYFAKFKQIVYLKEKNKLVKVAETGAIAGILKKSRPVNQQKSELIPHITFELPKLFTVIEDQVLRKELKRSYQPRSFEDVQIGDIIEIYLQVSHKMILVFALLSADYNPLHTDPEFVKELKAFEGKNIAHGALLNGWFSGIGVLELLGTTYHLVKKDESTFQRAVKVGDTILIQLEITDKFMKKEKDKPTFYAKVSEKIFLKPDSDPLIEAALSGSLYELYY